jgi:alpha-L-rhamnosidase
MKMPFPLSGFLFSLLLAFVPAPALMAQPAVTDLQCEHLVNPLGLDNIHPRFSWKMRAALPNEKQTAFQLFVGTDSASFWNSGKVIGDSNLVVYRGKPLQPFTRYCWRVKIWDNHGNAVESPPASFETAMLDPHGWQGEWITDTRNVNTDTAACFRKEIPVKKKIKSARAYIAAAGLYELWLNGRRVGDHELDPMFTRYDRRNLFVTYDITDRLQTGSNAIAVLLGNGWYNISANAAWDFNRAPWRNRPRFCLDLRITYTDGTTETVGTDKSWKTTPGPVVYNSIYVGEHYNGAREIPGWNSAGFDDSKWKNAIIATAPSQHIVAQSLQPIRITEKISPVSVKKSSDSDYLFDMGKNFAGITELKIKGEKGTIIKVKHAEQTDSAGHADQTGIDQHYYDRERIPFQTDIYTLNGEDETLRPHFNYKGFQYVEITSNKPIQLAKENIAAYFLHSDVPVAGSVQSSNELLNRIWQATNRSYLSNLMGYPTDCPQREKNGWTGDAHIAVETGLYNFDAITVYEKWLADFRDAQQPDGRLPAIVPTNEWWGYDSYNGLDWVSAIAIIPWELYRFYGDIRPLAENYDAIKAYIGLIERNYPSGLCNWGLGDWVPIKSFAPVEFTSTIYYYTDALILSKTAKLLNRKQDGDHYAKLADKIKSAFNKKYLDGLTGNYGQGLQTELSAALYWKLVPGHLIPKTAKLLEQRVIADGAKLDVGLLGSKTILNALSENGYADLAYSLASSSQYPSWGYWIAGGATTLYEGWERGKKLNFSLNHIMFGEIGAWMYKALGGIRPDPDHPGFKNILLEPHFVKGLDSFSCYHDGPYGRIESAWIKTAGAIGYRITIPANSTASLTLPAAGQVYEHGRRTANRLHLGSGTYRFLIKYSPN